MLKLNNLFKSMLNNIRQLMVGDDTLKHNQELIRILNSKEIKSYDCRKSVEEILKKLYEGRTPDRIKNDFDLFDLCIRYRLGCLEYANKKLLTNKEYKFRYKKPMSKEEEIEYKLDTIFLYNKRNLEKYMPTGKDSEHDEENCIQCREKKIRYEMERQYALKFCKFKAEFRAREIEEVIKNTRITNIVPEPYLEILLHKIRADYSFDLPKQFILNQDEDYIAEFDRNYSKNNEKFSKIFKEYSDNMYKKQIKDTSTEIRDEKRECKYSPTVQNTEESFKVGNPFKSEDPVNKNPFETGTSQFNNNSPALFNPKRPHFTSPELKSMKSNTNNEKIAINTSDIKLIKQFPSSTTPDMGSKPTNSNPLSSHLKGDVDIKPLGTMKLGELDANPFGSKPSSDVNIKTTNSNQLDSNTVGDIGIKQSESDASLVPFKSKDEKELNKEMPKVTNMGGSNAIGDNLSTKNIFKNPFSLSNPQNTDSKDTKSLFKKSFESQHTPSKPETQSSAFDMSVFNQSKPINTPADSNLFSINNQTASKTNGPIANPLLNSLAPSNNSVFTSMTGNTSGFNQPFKGDSTHTNSSIAGLFNQPSTTNLPESANNQSRINTGSLFGKTYNNMFQKGEGLFNKTAKTPNEGSLNQKPSIFNQFLNNSNFGNPFGSPKAGETNQSSSLNPFPSPVFGQSNSKQSASNESGSPFQKSKTPSSDFSNLFGNDGEESQRKRKFKK